MTPPHPPTGMPVDVRLAGAICRLTVSVWPSLRTRLSSAAAPSLNVWNRRPPVFRFWDFAFHARGWLLLQCV